MADFFTRLAGRTLGTVPVAQPVIPSMFAPQPLTDWKSDASVDSWEVEVEQEVSTPTRATQNVSRSQALVEPSVQLPHVHQPIVQQQTVHGIVPPIAASQESAGHAMQVEHLEPRVQELSASQRGMTGAEPSVTTIDGSRGRATGVGRIVVTDGSGPVMPPTTPLHELVGLNRLAPVTTRHDHIQVSESTQDASAPHIHKEESMDSVEIRETVYPQEAAPTRQIQRTFSQRVKQSQDKGSVSPQGGTPSSHSSVPIPTITKHREQRTTGETITSVTASSSRVVPQVVPPQPTPTTAASTQGMGSDLSDHSITEMIEISQDIVSKAELSRASARRERSHPHTDIQQPRWDVTQSPASEQQLIVAYDEQQAGSLQESSRTTPRQVMEQGTSPQQHEEATHTHTEMQSVQVIAHIEHTRTANNTQHSTEYAQPTTTPTIRVTIGRIDVRAVTSPTPEPKPRTGRQEPKVSLNQYLGRRQ